MTTQPSVAEQFAELEFVFINTGSRKNNFVIGKATNSVSLTVYNQGSLPFKLDGNSLEIDFSSFLTTAQIEALLPNNITGPNGWTFSKSVIPVPPPDGTAKIILTAPTGAADLGVGESITFGFSEITVTAEPPGSLSNNWIDINLSPSQGASVQQFAFFKESAAADESKQVLVEWPKDNGTIYITDPANPYNNHRQFHIKNPSNNPLLPNWQQQPNKPVFVVAFNPGVTENGVASADYIGDFTVELDAAEANANPKLWHEPKAVDVPGGLGNKVWEIRPTKDNPNLLDGNASLAINLVMSSDAALTNPKKKEEPEYSGAYMYVNQVFIGTTYAHQLQIFKEPAPTITSFEATKCPTLFKNEAKSFNSELTWATSQLNIAKGDRLSLTLNSGPETIIQSGVTSRTEALTETYNTLVLKAEKFNPHYVDSKEVKVHLKGATTGYYGSWASGAQWTSAAAFKGQTKFMLMDNGNNFGEFSFQANGSMSLSGVQTTIQLPDASLYASASSSQVGVIYNWKGKASASCLGLNINNKIVLQSGVFPINNIVGAYLAQKYTDVNGAQIICFTKNHIKYIDKSSIDSDTVQLPSTCSFDQGIVSTPNYKKFKSASLLLTSLANYQEWIAYDGSSGYFQTNAGSSADWSSPTWIGNDLVFIMNNPASNVWGIYKYDFASAVPAQPSISLIQNIQTLQNNTTWIKNIQYLEACGLLVMLDQACQVWVLDVNDGYSLVTPSSGQVSVFSSTIAMTNSTQIVSDDSSNILIYNANQEPHQTMLAALFS